MNDLLFLLATGLFCALLIFAGWRWLPGERWQFLATVPILATGSGWQGCNLTWYGAMLATATVLALGLTLTLACAAGQAVVPMLAYLVLLVGLGTAAAKVVASWVEGKRHTFTVGGASFCGLTAAVPAIWLVNMVGRIWGWPPLHLAPVLAVVAIGYVLGEGLGRIACISFGCCYGKPLSHCGRLAARLFAPVALVFSSPTKKAVYEGNLAGVPPLPIQGLTSMLYTVIALAASWWFLQGQFRAAFLLSLLVSQGWRVISELLRADFRGCTTTTAYQKMGLVAMVLTLCLGLLLPGQAAVPPAIASGLAAIFTPWLLLAGQGLWLVLFFFFGRSTVTDATIAFSVRRDRI